MAFPYQSALVTGGAGFIGSHLVDALVAGGCRVSVLDDLSAGKMENLQLSADGVDFHRGDIRDMSAVRRALGDCEAVFHLAAMVSVPQTVSDPLQSTEINIMGTVNVLEAARQRQCRAVIFASSCAVYGDHPQLPKTEQMPTQSLSPYAQQKLTAEQYLSLFHRIYDLSAVSLRFFNVYGPRQDPSSPYSGVISIFMNRALAQESPNIYGDGRQSRDFIYVKDIARALMLAAAPGAAGCVINVGSGKNVAIAELWEKISSLAGVRVPARYLEAREGDIRHSLSSIELAREVLGFAPSVDLDDGLLRTFEWYRENRIKGSRDY
jgi:UDP-glucose 4-epimerase